MCCCCAASCCRCFDPCMISCMRGILVDNVFGRMQPWKQSGFRIFLACVMRTYGALGIPTLLCRTHRFRGLPYLCAPRPSGISSPWELSPTRVASGFPWGPPAPRAVLDNQADILTDVATVRSTVSLPTRRSRWSPQGASPTSRRISYARRIGMSSSLPILSIRRLSLFLRGGALSGPSHGRFATPVVSGRCIFICQIAWA